MPQKPHIWLLSWALTLAVCAICGCASPLSAYRDFAYKNGWRESLVATSRFTHRIWFKPGVRITKSLHVYIEGDGQAWRTPMMPAGDPTSPEALMLQLMAQDPAPAIYVGRPCYLESTAIAPHNCSNAYWWTFGRYSEEVVASLVDAVTAQIAMIDTDAETGAGAPLTLIGHSGGGALVVLMAPRLVRTKTVITLAGNLDTDAWVRRHAYLPLTGSLNPAKLPPLPAMVAQWHFIGAQDYEIPSQAITRFCAMQISQESQRQVTCETIAATRHRAGWQNWWPSFVATVD